MTSTSMALSDFLAATPPFDCLSPVQLAQVTRQLQRVRYRMGQAIALGDTMPAQIVVLYQGQARRLSTTATALPETLERVNPGAIFGWISLLRGVPCETVIASTESVGLVLGAQEFQQLLAQSPDFARAFTEQASIQELYELLSAEFNRQAIGTVDLITLAQKLVSEAVVLTLPQGQTAIAQLDPNVLWFLSGGRTNVAIGDRIGLTNATLTIESETARVIGIRNFDLLLPQPALDTDETEDIPYAADRPPALVDEAAERKIKYPHVSGRGPIQGTLACFQMLAELWGMPCLTDKTQESEKGS